MELSATDIRNHRFANQLRGYDKTEVDTFKEQVAKALEQAKQDQIRATMELEALKLQMSGFKQFEDTIKGAAIDARRNADATVAAAKKEAEILLQKAKDEIERLKLEHHQRVAESEAQLQNVEQMRQTYVQKLRSVITSHLEMVEAQVAAQTKAEPAPMRTAPMSSPAISTPRPDAPTPSVVPSKIATTDNLDIIRPPEVKRTRRDMVIPAPKSQNLQIEEAELADPDVAALHDAIRGDETPPRPVDPDLAAALEKYAHGNVPGHEESIPAASVPDPGELIEPSLRAEDIPLGFVSNDAEVSSPPSPAPPPSSGEPIPADSLAQALDAVVEKFAEEMDKAAKS
ncbi:MAG: DivIVA domain-containing protein [candidate division Zixibacteria bacterium]|nr:DivIVA domain-containing protein [candidate division Zixibacteria bacterium]